MIHYDIDTTENAYCKLEGDAEALNELKQILFKNDVVPDLVGYLSFDNVPNVSVCISAQKELGFIFPRAYLYLFLLLGKFLRNICFLINYPTK